MGRSVLAQVYRPPASQTRRRPARQDRRRRGAVLRAGAVALALLVLIPPAMLAARPALETVVLGELRRAQADLESGGRQLELAYERRDPALAVSAEGSFSGARRDFAAVSYQARSVSGAVESAPSGALRAQVDSLTAVCDLGGDLGQAGLTTTRALVEGGVVEGAGSASSGRLVDRLQQLRDELHQADLASGRIALDAVPAGQRPALQKLRTELGTLIGVVEQYWDRLPALLDIFGLNGPRTYLVEQVNPAELRAGGGFIGSVSLVRAAYGHLDLARSLPVESFDYCDAAACVHHRPRPGTPGYVAPPSELTGYPLPPQSRVTAWSLEDSGFFPDFPSNAVVAEQFAARLLGVKPDGVIAVDYYAVAPLLQVTGPIQVPGVGLELNAQNFVQTLVRLDLDRSANHKTVISEAAGEILARLDKVGSSGLTRALPLVMEAAAERHLQVYFNSRPAEDLASQLGWGNRFQAGPDFLLETEDNLGGSKANYFLERDYRLTLTRSGAALHHRLEVGLVDRAPADRPYDGPHYYAYVRLYVPSGADDLEIGSVPSHEYAAIQEPGRRTQVPPPGASVAGGWIFVLVGRGLSGRYTVTFDWDTRWAPDAQGEQIISWGKQPGTWQDPVQVIWKPGSGAFNASARMSQPLRLALSADRLQVAPAEGIRRID